MSGASKFVCCFLVGILWQVNTVSADVYATQQTDGPEPLPVSAQPNVSMEVQRFEFPVVPVTENDTELDKIARMLNSDDSWRATEQDERNRLATAEIAKPVAEPGILTGVIGMIVLVIFLSRRNRPTLLA